MQTPQQPQRPNSVRLPMVAEALPVKPTRKRDSSLAVMGIAFVCFAFALFMVVGTLAFGVIGCGTINQSGIPMASMGATPGGAQDMGFARSAIERGEVPQPQWILTEGLFSEHDLTLEGAPAEHLLSLNLGSGVVRDASGTGHYIVQVGMSSNIKADEFKRRPLNLSLVLDVSGSMSGDKIAAARRAASTIVRKLNDQDVLSLVTFNHGSEVLVSSRYVKDRNDFEKAINKIEANGSTNMEAGLVDGIAQVSRKLDLKSHEHRVIFITDALPNTGRHNENDFLRLAESASAKGIGLTAFGVGLDFGIELATSISNIRGGNYRFMRDAGDLGKIFEEEFETLVTPLAYDLKLEMKAAPGFRITAVHGVPGWKDGDSLASVDVKTVFISKRGGAMAFELKRTGHVEAGAGGATPLEIAEVGLRYTEIGGQPVSQQGRVTLPEDAHASAAWFSHGGVAKTAALAFASEGMRRACKDFHAGHGAGAAAHLSGVPELIEKAADRTGDSTLANEARLVRKLIQNIEQRTSKVTRWDNQRPEHGNTREQGSTPQRDTQTRELNSPAGKPVRW